MFNRKHQQPVERRLGATPEVGYGDPDDGQDYVDRSKLTFDPVNGLLSGTAIPAEQHYHPQHALGDETEPAD
jgi:hypothetical protein